MLKLVRKKCSKTWVVFCMFDLSVMLVGRKLHCRARAQETFRVRQLQRHSFCITLDLPAARKIAKTSFSGQPELDHDSRVETREMGFH